MRWFFRIPLALCCYGLILGNAFAWGPQGHRLVARIAMVHLSDKARTEVAQLLALEPGATLPDVSTWADENRSADTARWHFVNFPKGQGCRFDAVRDCPGGNCVVAAIRQQTDLLASNAAPESRLQALKFVVHLVADVHQPLHAGHLEDRGGNTYQLQAFSEGTSLHAFWDSGLLAQTGKSLAALADVRSPAPPGAADLDPVHAAEESCRIVEGEGFYPGRMVGPEYVRRYLPVAEQRLHLAGLRLAGLLNRALR